MIDTDITLLPIVIEMDLARLHAMILAVNFTFFQLQCYRTLSPPSYLTMPTVSHRYIFAAERLVSKPYFRKAGCRS